MVLRMILQQGSKLSGICRIQHKDHKILVTGHIKLVFLADVQMHFGNQCPIRQCSTAGCDQKHQSHTSADKHGNIFKSFFSKKNRSQNNHRQNNSP